jgi:hypothetical protein
MEMPIKEWPLSLKLYVKIKSAKYGFFGGALADWIEMWILGQ